MDTIFQCKESNNNSIDKLLGMLNNIHVSVVKYLFLIYQMPGDNVYTMISKLLEQ